MGRSLPLCAGLLLAVCSQAAAAPRAWPEGSTPVATVEGLAQGPQLVDSRKLKVTVHDRDGEHRRVVRTFRLTRKPQPPAIAGRITSVSESSTAVSSPPSTRTSSSLR